MRRIAITLAILPGLFLPAFAKEADKTVCIQPVNIRSTTVVDDRTILFHMNSGKVWKNTLRRTCHGLKFENGFTWEIRGSTVCSNQQVIHVLNTGTPCFLGEFTSYEEAENGEEADKD